mgnify:FL=1|tara:strand:+ start:1080 stop:1277 length:198 start_codon:yes stop_codon:yes gene_type:complete
MKKYTVLFLILAVITGVVGFTGLRFTGIEVIRVVCLVAADLFVISLMAKLFFPDKKLRLQRIKKE